MISYDIYLWFTALTIHGQSIYVVTGDIISFFLMEYSYIIYVYHMLF